MSEGAFRAGLSQGFVCQAAAAGSWLGACRSAQCRAGPGAAGALERRRAAWRGAFLAAPPLSLGLRRGRRVAFGASLRAGRRGRSRRAS